MGQAMEGNGTFWLLIWADESRRLERQAEGKTSYINYLHREKMFHRTQFERPGRFDRQNLSTASGDTQAWLHTTHQEFRTLNRVL